MSAEALGRPTGADDLERNPDRPSESVSKAAVSMPRMVAPGGPPLVPSGGFFEGEIAVLGDTRIDGRVRGSLRGPGRVLVGSDARIEGELQCGEVDSEGSIQGPIAARRLVRLGPGARLDGDIQAPRVEVCDSAIWNGVAQVGEPRKGADPEI